MGFSILKLFQDTALYSSGQIFPRLAALLLLPIMSRFLTPADYGILGQIAILSLVATSIVGFGLNMSLAKCYFDTGHRNGRNGLIWSSFAMLLFLNALVLGLVIIFSSSLSSLLLGTSDFGALIIIASASVCISGLIIPFVSYLKLEQKAGTVVFLAVIEVLMTTGLSFYFVISQGLGVMGPLLAQLIAQALLLVLFFGIILVKVPLTFFVGKEFWAAFFLGLPYMFSFLGSFLIQSGTRFALVETRGLEEGGIYFVSQNCAKVLELFVMGLTTAWLPLYAQSAQDKESSSHSINKVFNAFILLISIPIAASFLFAKPVLSILVPFPLSSGWKVVGLLALSQGILGVYAIMQPAFVFAKKSLLQVCMEGACGAIGVATALFLAFHYGIEGAACAQVFACTLLALASIFTVRSLLGCHFETRRLKKVFLALFAIALSSYFQPDSLALQLLESASIFLFYIYFLWRDLITQEEKSRISLLFS